MTTSPQKYLWIALLTVSAGAGCATPSYLGFYKRYAGTCQASTVRLEPPTVTAGPRVAAFKAAFVEALDDEATAVRQCYSDALRYGEVHGKVALQILVDTNGHTQKVSVAEDTTGFAPLACCVVAVVRDLKLKPTHERDPIGLEYPFSFRTLRMPSQAADSQTGWLTAGARPDGFVTELDEASVVVGGASFYPVGQDGLHHFNDSPEVEAANLPAQPSVTPASPARDTSKH